MNKAFLLSLGLGVLVVGCSKKQEEPPPPAPAPAPAAAVAPASASPAKLPEKPASTPTASGLAPAPAPAPVILTTPPPATAVAPAAPATPAVPKETSPATTAAQALKEGALDALQRATTDARNSLLPPATTPASAPAATPATTPAHAATSLADLSTDQVTRGLKEALAKGLQQAVSSLGHSGGFMTNLNVRIPMPEKLQTVEKTLRALHQDRIADDFVATMNQAAEQAVPAAADVFTGSLSKMTVDDARKILTGTNNAATRYFRQTSEQELRDRFLPIVQKATASTGVTAAYKQILDRAKITSPFLSSSAVDVDGYVTDKALDGLFTMVAAEEKRIRENPMARTTDLLKSVFGSLGR